MVIPADITPVLAPNPGPQTLALQCPIDDLLYGGARGGGKGVFLILDMIRHDQESKGLGRGLLIRKKLTDLRDFIKESRMYLSKLGWRYNISEKTWISPLGSEFVLAYLEHEDDWENYQGWNLSWLAIDEVGQYKNSDIIDKLYATLRKPDVPRKSLRLTANPGGPGHEWLKKRYVDRAPPGVPFTDYIVTPSGEKLPTMRVYIPARLKDNPAANTPEYRAMLAQAGPAYLVKAWLEGDWNVIPSGGVFDCDNINLADSHPPLDRMRIYVGLDGAFTTKTHGDHTAIVVWGVDEARRHWILDVWRDRWDVLEASKQLIAIWRKYGPAMTWIEGGPHGLAIEPYLKERRSDKQVWQPFELVSHLQDKIAKAMPLAALVNDGQLWVQRDAPWWPSFRDELLIFRGEDEANDQVDAAGIVARSIRRVINAEAPPAPPKPKVERSSKDHRKQLVQRVAAKKAAAKKGRGRSPLRR